MAKAVSVHTIPHETLQQSLEYIAENIRDADRQEVEASCDLPVLEALEQSVAASSLCWLIVDRTGLPVGVFGVAAGVVPGLGVPWLISANGIEQDWVSVARQTRPKLAEMHELFPILSNWVDARNELAMHWLLWGGFHFVDADAQHGVGKKTFIQFTRTAHV